MVVGAFLCLILNLCTLWSLCICACMCVSMMYVSVCIYTETRGRCQLSFSIASILFFETEYLTEPKRRLAASKAHRSSCPIDSAPTKLGVTRHTCVNTKLVTWELGSSSFYNKHSCSLCPFSTPYYRL